MNRKKQRRSVTDRARRRAIRAHATALGVPYSVAARLLMTQAAADPDNHRAWLFAMRERRSFALRVQDTRIAAGLPLGRAAHLAERFPPWRSMIGRLYDGEHRQAALAMLYALLEHESPALVPTAERFDWVAGLGEQTAVDFVCETVDRAARLLLDLDRWHLCTRIESALAAWEASGVRSRRDAAKELSQEFRTMIPRRALAGARHTLDALLVEPYGGYPPGTEILMLTGPCHGESAIVVGARWTGQGPPTHYEVLTDAAAAVMTFEPADLVLADQQGRPASGATVAHC